MRQWTFLVEGQTLARVSRSITRRMVNWLKHAGHASVTVPSGHDGDQRGVRCWRQF